MVNNHMCPFCGQSSYHGEWVIQGRGRRALKQWFHRSCFEASVKNKTYWNFKLSSGRL